ncbi:hypothetical protein F383_38813 [Gossypium arboreum]|uniref:Uncharacterized protein n=1 Tax=Gossypium arboreum TaxID=29729 RepID=A0A0B0MKU2_GOSAR|nr:hypothetical protein F383_38813 [Gossypium arboreum]
MLQIEVLKCWKLKCLNAVN